MRIVIRFVVILSLTFEVSVLQARIISYAPVTDRIAVPALQARTNRYFVLIETEVPPSPFAPVSNNSQLVLYDSRGEDEPRVILGREGGVRIYRAAVREDENGVSQLLVATNTDLEGDNPFQTNRYLYSADSGTTWKPLVIPADSAPSSSDPDTGGPFVHGRGSAIRIGPPETPFVLAATAPSNALEIWAVHRDSATSILHRFDLTGYRGGFIGLAGADISGTRFLVAAPNPDSSVLNARALYLVTTHGSSERLVPLSGDELNLDGWVTPDGAVYLESTVWYTNSARTSLFVVRDGARDEVVIPQPGDATNRLPIFAVPTHDYTGAWIVQRSTGRPTVLFRHRPGGSVTEQWRDVTSPAVEAVHTAASGERLLIQADRPRPQADERTFKDPALAVWEIGDGAPKRYEELYLNEGRAKAFVHLDVDTVTDGGVFVFDAASVQVSSCPFCPPPPPSAPPGGSDVTQEWGVVRASFRQRLVLTGLGRTPGAYGSLWRSDLIIQNPLDERLAVDARYVPTNGGGLPSHATVMLEPREVRVVRDALKTLFAVENGAGALFLTPEKESIGAFSRTFVEGVKGSYGMGMGAIDLFAASSARFPVTFAGAIQGSGFRTNLVATDAGARGSLFALRAATNDGSMGREDFQSTIGQEGQAQVNDIGAALALPPWQSAAINFSPQSGAAIASIISIDNRTNDPTYFPPDLPAPEFRTIPAIAHLDGANGAKFRSDLFLFNPASTSKTVTLMVKLWDVNETESRLVLTLLPLESKVIRDVLMTAFRKAGVARLRFLSGSLDTTGVGDPLGVRVTSRLYTLDPEGGTYGQVMPPLNSFQSAGPGESLEILGAVADPSFRINLGLVDLAAASANGGATRVRVEISSDRGLAMDSFDLNVPRAGGVQLFDLFKDRGLTPGTGAILIRVSPVDSVIGAFASMIDNGTNDPILLTAGLATRE